jgi:methylmalonyl-CoA mutase N-terminal domain/subunit
MIALRTQQILGYESGVASVIDPLAGSYFVESLTDRLESEALGLISRIDELGGAVAAIEAGFQQREIEDAAYEHARSVEADTTVIVGVNRFDVPGAEPHDVLRIDPSVERDQIERLRQLRSDRDTNAVDVALDVVRSAAAGDTNLLYPIRDALRLEATIGEVSAALVGVFGRYRHV